MATIDWEQFNENFQYYEKDTVKEVIDNFFEEAEERLLNLEKNIAERDFAKLAFNAHSLKSVVGNFMAPATYELCRKLEELAKQNAEGEVGAIFGALKLSINDLIQELKAYIQK